MLRAQHPGYWDAKSMPRVTCRHKCKPNLLGPGLRVWCRLNPWAVRSWFWRKILLHFRIRVLS